MAPPRAPLLVACAAVLTALSRGHGHGHGNSQQQKQQFKPFSTSITGLGAPPLGDTPVNAPGVSVMTENSLAHVDQLAVCNDGSPAAYYFAPGSGDGANTWLVYLEGAMFCWDRESCALRYQTMPYYMSSTAKAWSSEFAQGGIFATDGSSRWGNANRAYLKYCSSDLWSGDADASDDTFGWQFRGSRIVRAALSDLAKTHGLGRTPGARLLFGGCSAGAIGAMNWLDTVPSMVPHGVTVSGFLDGAALLNIQPRGWDWSPYLEPLPSLVANMTVLASSVFPSYCKHSFPGEEWKCLIGQFRMPLITTVPYFINAPQFDDFNLMYVTDNYLPVSRSQLSLVEEFQAGILQLIAALPSGTGVFAPTCLVHCLSGGAAFTSITSAGVTLDAALSAWYDGQPVLAASTCVGWNCVHACGIDMHTSLPCMMGVSGCSAITAMQSDPGATTSTDQAGLDTSTVPAAMAAVKKEERKLPTLPPAPQAGSVTAVEPALSPAQQAALHAQQAAQQQHDEQTAQQRLDAQKAQQKLDEQKQQQALDQQQQNQHRRRLAANDAAPWQHHAMQRLMLAARGCCGQQA